MIYVTDTHPFVWYLTEDDRLGKNAKEIFERAEEGIDVIAVPTIVLAECLYLLEKDGMTVKFKDIIEKVEIGWNYTVLPFDMTIMKSIISMKGLKELHDKIITASAKILNAKLITKDAEIKKCGYVETIW
jgi:predicted nucleic acid-binding protein